MVAHTCNPSISEAEQEDYEFEDTLGLHSKTLSLSHDETKQNKT
jgi:hypothetical protein